MTVTDLILCHECGHDIDEHRWDGCFHEETVHINCLDECDLSTADIARAYAEERWLDGVDVGYVLGRFHSKQDEKGHRE